MSYDFVSITKSLRMRCLVTLWFNWTQRFITKQKIHRDFFRLFDKFTTKQKYHRDLFRLVEK